MLRHWDGLQNKKGIRNTVLLAFPNDLPGLFRPVLLSRFLFPEMIDLPRRWRAAFPEQGGLDVIVFQAIL
jgi:hypothetical protein